MTEEEQWYRELGRKLKEVSSTLKSTDSAPLPTTINPKFYSTIESTDCRYLSKEEYENGEQGMVGWNISEDILHFSCGAKMKVNRKSE